jgi:hypothetical protein
MGVISYGEDETPDYPPEMAAVAIRHGMFVIQIICGDHSDSVNFMALVNAVPRVGERVILEDGKICRVKDVRHVVSKLEEFPALMTTIFAEFLDPKNIPKST